MYLAEFVQCKRAALNLIAACAESGADADLGILLLHDRNINITRDGGIQFNYFMDFAELKEEQKRRSIFSQQRKKHSAFWN